MSINNTEYINKYKIKYTNGGFSTTVTIAEEVVQITNEGQIGETITSYFRNVLNLSQLTTTKTGTKINPEKAREVLDTNIFELLPTQTTRQDQINEFFNEFNDLIGQAPQFDDVDGDGAGESISNDVADRTSRIDLGVNPNAYITRLNRHTIEAAPNGPANVGKTLESMRNKLNTYLGDVDNVVQVIPDQRPEYENKSSGFLKIRKPNQAIILRNSNDMLEFQKDNSYLTDGFTITMWVRFVGKTGRGTLFNFGNPTSTESPYGFRLETITREDAGVYRRMVRLVVRDHLSTVNGTGKVYDSHFGTVSVNRYDTNIDFNTGNAKVFYKSHSSESGYTIEENAFKAHTQIPTNDLNEWFFICATYNPGILEDESLSGTYYDDYKNNKQFWLNHIDPAEEIADNTLFQNFTIGTLTGPRNLSIETSYNDVSLPIHNDITLGEDGTDTYVITIVDDNGNEYSNFIFGKSGSPESGYDLIGYFIGPPYDSGTDEANEIYNDLYGEGAEVQVSVGVQTTPPSPSILTQEWDSLINTEDVATMVANSGFGARCKVEVISRSDLLRARGYKVDTLEVNVEEETTEQQQSSG